MSFTIKKANYKDSKLLTNLIRKSFKDVAKRFNLNKKNAPTHPSNCSVEWIKEALDKGIKYYILEYQKKPCGCIALEIAKADVCYLERLAVLPKYRKKGFGKALVSCLIQEARAMKIKRIEIGIIAENVELKKWYEKFGFSVSKTVGFEHLAFDVTFMFKNI
ncbi:MAG: GNAT family N-acetyltransferase [Promethearchaeota archaeon]